MGNCNSVDPVDETTIEPGVEIVQKSSLPKFVMFL